MKEMSKKRPLILVTNDDGIQAKGLRSLIEAVEPFGDIVIVAPDKPLSGMGHAITVNDVLKDDTTPEYDNYNAYTCTRTPVDNGRVAVADVISGKHDRLLYGLTRVENSCSDESS